MGGYASALLCSGEMDHAASVAGWIASRPDMSGYVLETGREPIRHPGLGETKVLSWWWAATLWRQIACDIGVSGWLQAVDGLQDAISIAAQRRPMVGR